MPLTFQTEIEQKHATHEKYVSRCDGQSHIIQCACGEIIELPCRHADDFAFWQVARAIAEFNPDSLPEDSRAERDIGNAD